VIVPAGTLALIPEGLSPVETADTGDQGRLPPEVAALVDAGLIRSTIHADLGPITAANLKRAAKAMGQALDDAVAQVAGAVSLSVQPHRASFPR